MIISETPTTWAEQMAIKVLAPHWEASDKTQLLRDIAKAFEEIKTWAESQEKERAKQDRLYSAFKSLMAEAPRELLQQMSDELGSELEDPEDPAVIRKKLLLKSEEVGWQCHEEPGIMVVNGKAARGEEAPAMPAGMIFHPDKDDTNVK
jgi:hypothetical protein